MDGGRQFMTTEIHLVISCSSLRSMTLSAKKLDVDFTFEDEPEDEEDEEGEWDECSSDEERDALDIMKKIRIGDRRSTRERKQPDTLLGYMSIPSDLIQITKPKSKKKKEKRKTAKKSDEEPRKKKPKAKESKKNRS